MEAKTENDASESMVGLLSEPRRRRILEWLQEEGSARVRELAIAFHVSEATIRQDLERLENEGFITREHGGAYLNPVSRQIGTMTLHGDVTLFHQRPDKTVVTGVRWPELRRSTKESNLRCSLRHAVPFRDGDTGNLRIVDER